jgi:hypothetical protein
LDEERKERIKRLAQIADERWITKGQHSPERLAVGSSGEALKGIICEFLSDCSDSGYTRNKVRRVEGYGSYHKEGIARTGSRSKFPTPRMVRESRSKRITLPSSLYERIQCGDINNYTSIAHFKKSKLHKSFCSLFSLYAFFVSFAGSIVLLLLVMHVEDKPYPLQPTLHSPFALTLTTPSQKQTSLPHQSKSA